MVAITAVDPGYTVKGLTTSCLGIDTETTGLSAQHGDRPYAVSMCDGKKVWYFRAKVDPFTRKVTWGKKDIEEIKRIIKRYKVLVFHNLKFDMRMLASIGIDLYDRCLSDGHDTALCSHALDSREDFGRHRLKPLAKTFLKIDDADEKELRKKAIDARAIGKQKGWTLAEDVEADYWMINLAWPKDDKLETYACLDAERTYWLFVKIFVPALHRAGLFKHYEKQRRVLFPIYKMESRGVSILPTVLSKEIKRLTSMREHHAKAALAVLPKGMCENLGSGKQLQGVLYDHLKLPILYRTDPSSRFPDGQPSTDKDTLKELLGKCKPNSKAYKFIENYLTQAGAETSVTYLIGYDKKRIRFESDKITRLFPSFNVTGTATLRLSSSNPNAQNVGRGKELEFDDGTKIMEFRLRTVFGPGPNRIWYALDYDQLQLRIFAKASKEDRMVQAFADGFDFHTWMGCMIFGVRPEDLTKKQRTIAKNVNFGYIFGAGPAKIESTSGMKGLSTQLKTMFPNVTEFMKETIAYAKEKGFVYTLGGYRLGIERKRAYSSVCIIVQGTEGEIVKNAMCRVDNLLSKEGDDFYTTLQVHDELVFDANLKKIKQHPAILRGIKQQMEDAGAEVGVTVVAKCEVNRKNWADLEKISL